MHQILDIELLTVEFSSERAKTREERERWLQWTVLSYEELGKLYQPPYGDRPWCSSTRNKSLERVGLCLVWRPLGNCPPCTLSTTTHRPTSTRRNLAAITPCVLKRTLS
jgi:hypothetical protein